MQWKTQYAEHVTDSYKSKRKEQLNYESSEKTWAGTLKRGTSKLSDVHLKVFSKSSRKVQLQAQNIATPLSETAETDSTMCWRKRGVTDITALQCLRIQLKLTEKWSLHLFKMPREIMVISVGPASARACSRGGDTLGFPSTLTLTGRDLQPRSRMGSVGRMFTKRRQQR